MVETIEEAALMENYFYEMSEYFSYVLFKFGYYFPLQDNITIWPMFKETIFYSVFSYLIFIGLKEMHLFYCCVHSFYKVQREEIIKKKIAKK